MHDSYRQNLNVYDLFLYHNQAHVHVIFHQADNAFQVVTVFRVESLKYVTNQIFQELNQQTIQTLLCEQ